MTNTSLWDARAGLGPAAGTRDLIAAELERRYIAGHVRDGMRVLDVGCGNGTTLFWLCESKDIRAAGFDSSPEMISEAFRALYRTPQYNVTFAERDVMTYAPPWDLDLVYSQRCLINLPDWPAQERAVRRILSWLNPGGRYVALECSADGLEETNDLRAAVDLPAITPPSHNRYLRDAEMAGLGGALWNEGKGWLVSVERVCGTYQLLSRVLNARLAADEGREPEYDAPLNQLALKVPNVVSIGQNTAWVYERCR